MDGKLKVIVVTHEGSVIDSSCSSLKFFSVSGDVGIIPGHITSLFNVKFSDVTLETDEVVSESFYIGAGIVSVRDNVVTILTNECVLKESIDNIEQTKLLNEANENYTKAKDFTAKDSYLTSKLICEAKLRIATA